MVWKKYLVIILGVMASVMMWWKVITTPNIPSPIFQGLIFTAVMVFFVWFSLGFSRKKKVVSVDEFNDYLISSNFLIQSKDNVTTFQKNTVIIKIKSFERKLEATKEFNQLRHDLVCDSDITYQSDKRTASYFKSVFESSNDYFCLVLVDFTIITMTAPINAKDDIIQIIKELRF